MSTTNFISNRIFGICKPSANFYIDIQRNILPMYFSYIDDKWDERFARFLVCKHNIDPRVIVVSNYLNCHHLSEFIKSDENAHLYLKNNTDIKKHLVISAVVTSSHYVNNLYYTNSGDNIQQENDITSAPNIKHYYNKHRSFNCPKQKYYNPDDCNYVVLEIDYKL